MWFFKSFYRSLFDIAWLREQRVSGIGKALGFFTVVIFLVSLFRFGPVAFFLAPRGLDKAVAAVQQIPDFKATVNDGKLSVENLPQPFSYSFKGEDQNLLVYVDTVSTSTPSVESLLAGKNNGGVILITHDEARFYDAESKHTELETYADFPNNTTLTKTEVVNFVSKIQGARSWIGIALQVLAFIAQWVFELLAVLWWSFILWALSRVRKTDWRYAEVVRVGLFALTLPLLLSTVFMLMATPVSMVKTLAWVVIMYLVIWVPKPTVPEIAKV